MCLSVPCSQDLHENPPWWMQHSCCQIIIYLSIYLTLVLCVHVKQFTPAWRIGYLLTLYTYTRVISMCIPSTSLCTIFELIDCIHINATWGTYLNDNIGTYSLLCTKIRYMTCIHVYVHLISLHAVTFLQRSPERLCLCCGDLLLMLVLLQYHLREGMNTNCDPQLSIISQQCTLSI